MKKYNQKLGKIGEKIALKYLLKNDFEIIETNFYTKWGEIDIIAQKNNRLHFVEVKTRTNLTRGRPEEAVTKHKYQRSKRAIFIFFSKNIKYKNKIYQIDILAIMYNHLENKAKIRFFENILI